MEYQVIARKYRPQNFFDIIGQDHVAETLKNSISTGRIGHAFLFTGPRGVGKTTTARILAKALECKEGPVPEPCNKCDACLEITAGNCIDVLEIDGASNRGIDEIRDLKEKIRYTPLRERYKIYVIDEVHMLTREAFNALLKTLEEPPDHAKFVFATTEIHKVPATIQSRCQRFDFKLVPMDKVLHTLEKICDGEKINLSPKSLRIIAQSAAGSLRDAQSLLEKVISFSGENIDEDTILPLLGLANPELLKTLISSIAEQQVETCFSCFDRIFNSGADMLQFYAQIRDQFRVLLLIKTLKNPEQIVDIPGDEIIQWKIITDRVSEDELYSWLRILVEAETDVRQSLNPRLTIEMIFLRMTRIKRLQNVAELLKEIRELKAGTDSFRNGSDGFDQTEIPIRKQQEIREFTPHPEPVQPEKTEKAPSAPLTPDATFIEAIAKKNLVLSSYLETGEFHGPENGTVTITYPDSNRFAYEKVTTGPNTSLAEKVCRELFGKDITFRINLTEKTDDPANNQIVQKEKLKKKALKIPTVKKTLEKLDGEISHVD